MDPQRSRGSREVDEYLAALPPDSRAALERLRRTIRAAAPEAEELISYRIPAFRQHGLLVWYAAFGDHCSFFVGGLSHLPKLSAELMPFTAGRGTLRFTPEHAIPVGLVKRIVKARIAVNESRLAEKHSTPRRAPNRTTRERRRNGKRRH